jgi:alpha-1,6-mannosyltransferase
LSAPPGAVVAAPRYRLIRYAGFAGSVLLAIAAYLGGAMPTLLPDVTPVSIWRGEHGPLIIFAWLVGTALLTGAWWAGRRGVPSIRWAYLTAALWMLPLLAAPPFGSRDVYAYACQGASYADGLNPYTQGVSALPCPWLDSVSPIWRDTPAPYGPFFMMIAGGIVALGGSLAVTVALFRLVAVLGIGLLAFGLPVLARRCGVPVSRAVWLVLACPLAVIHLAGGAHNDALMVGLLVAGLAAVSARPGRPGPLVLGGALLGLAVAIKVPALVVVPFAAVAAVAPGRMAAGPARGAAERAPYPLRGLVRDGGFVVGGAVGAVGVASLASGFGLGWLKGLSHGGDAVAWTSPPTAVGLTIGYAGRPFGAHLDALFATRAVAVVVLAAVLVLLWWRVLRDPDRSAVHGAGLALVAVVAFSPVFQPWYLIWPLAVLAAGTSRSTWLAVLCAVAGFLVLADGTALARFTRFPGAVAMAVMVIAAVVIAVRHLRRGRELPIGPPRRADLVRS